jgi:hypothetical protein
VEVGDGDKVIVNYKLKRELFQSTFVPSENPNSLFLFHTHGSARLFLFPIVIQIDCFIHYKYDVTRLVSKPGGA